MNKSLLTVLSAAAIIALVACGGTSACPPDSNVQQQQGAQIIASRCVSCHSSKLTGAARSGAPEGYDFDDPAIVQSKAGEMLSDVESGKMPKTGALGAAEVDAVRAYLNCLGEP